MPFLWLVQSDVREPTYAALLAALLGYRVWSTLHGSRTGFPVIGC